MQQRHQEIVSEVRAACVRVGSQRRVAALSGVPQSRLSEWLNGRRDMRLGDILSVMSACGLTLRVEVDDAS